MKTRMGTVLLVAALLVVVAVGGCAVTQQEAVKPSSLSGFLGDYSKLTPGGPGQAELRYVNPNVQWTQYNKIMIQPVTFWGGETTEASAAARRKQRHSGSSATPRMP